MTADVATTGLDHFYNTCHPGSKPGPYDDSVNYFLPLFPLCYYALWMETLSMNNIHVFIHVCEFDFNAHTVIHLSDSDLCS